MKRILAIDQGTTASKAAIYSLSGRLLGLGRAKLETRLGPAGRARQDPERILATQRLAIDRAIAQAGRGEIVAAGVASQRSTFVLWDRATGRPAGPAPTWQSTEGAALCSSLRRHAGRVRRLTGLPLSPHYSASKLSMWLERDARIRRRAERGDLLFGTVACYLIWRLGGGRTHAVDPTQAARTLLMGIDAADWHPWLLDLFGVPRAMLPGIRDTLADYGALSIRGREIPVTACLGDQQAALMALAGASRRRGPCLVNYGTGAFVLVPTGPRPARIPGLLTSLAWSARRERAYLLEGTVNTAGSALDWLRRDLGAPEGLRRIDALCRSAPGRAVALAAFHGAGSIFFDGPAPPGSIILEAGPDGTLADLTRATVESIAGLVALTLDRAAAAGRAPARLVATGPLAGLRYLVECQAALGPCSGVAAAREPEATLKGAARAAALAAGGQAAARAAAWRIDLEPARPAASLVRAVRERHERWRRMIRWAARMR